MAQIRQPAVAGQFYPSSQESLRKQIEEFSKKKGIQNSIPEEAIGCLLPHAGYIYSGFVAYSVVSSLKVKNNLIILGPNHTGTGGPFSIFDDGSWITPLGSVNINASLVNALLSKAPFLKSDYEAHRFEHSVEVQLPILQYVRRDFSFAPIVILSNDFTRCRELGWTIASVVKELGLEKEVLIIASSDMNHYEEASVTKKKDKQAIQAILELEEAKLWLALREYDISMCGYAPAVAMISAAKALGAKSGKLIKYQTSGDINGDNSSVVGYAGIIVS